jgi:hypothetical protein
MFSHFIKYALLPSYLKSKLEDGDPIDALLTHFPIRVQRATLGANINIIQEALDFLKRLEMAEGNDMNKKSKKRLGRAIAQAVSRRLPTAAIQLRAQVRSCGICDGQSGTGASFLRVLRFPLPSLFPPTAAHSSFIIRGRYNKPNSGRRTKWTQSHPLQETN